MQIKLFTIPINEIESYNEELNKFLRTHKIMHSPIFAQSTEKYSIDSGGASSSNELV